MSIAEPAKIITPWADTGSKNPIPQNSNNTTGAAGYDDGFPDITMTPPEAGGVPPSGQDFNGIFYEITKILQYMQAGGQPTFSATLASGVGGYPIGAMVLGDDGVAIYTNRVDGNSSNPNSGGSGWARSDLMLREALRRSYAEAGYNLVAGSFEIGGTVTSATDVLLYEADGHAYNWGGVLPKVVAPGSSPTPIATGAWLSLGDVTLRDEFQAFEDALSVSLAIPKGGVYVTSRELSVLERIPKHLHQYLHDVNLSRIHAGDLAVYLNAAAADCVTHGLYLTFPAGYFYVGDTFNLPTVAIGTLDTYILALSPLQYKPVLSVDYAGQRMYNMEGFQVIGNRTGFTPGLRIGGCRNSVFKQLVFTSCSAGALICPTHPDSGDVENIELNHIWTVQCQAGIHVATNSSISRGNITDGTFQNLQLTADSAQGGDGIPLLFTASAGKQIFGLKFDRVFTSAGVNTHMNFQPNGGSIFSNFFSNITGEPRGAVNQRAATISVSSGEFFSNDFFNVYPIGMPGDGLVLSNGNYGNSFRGLGLSDSQISDPGTNNKWITVQPGANFNVFEINKRVVNDSLYLAGPTNALSFNVALGDINSGAKMVDLGTGNSYEGAFTSKPTVLVPRSKIFSFTGAQLTNYPLPGCFFYEAGEGFVVQVPAGSAEYVLTIPHELLDVGRGSPLVSVMMAYECPANMNGLQVSIGLDADFKTIQDYRPGTWRYAAFTGSSSGSNGAVKIKFGGTRTIGADFYVQDLIISAGESLPFHRNIIRNVFDNA